MQLCVVHVRLPQWFWFADKSPTMPVLSGAGMEYVMGRGSCQHSPNSKRGTCVDLSELIEKLITRYFFIFFRNTRARNYIRTHEVFCRWNSTLCSYHFISAWQADKTNISDRAFKNVKRFRYLGKILIKQNKIKPKIPWPESASENNLRLSAKLVSNLRIEHETWSAWRIPTAVFSNF
jgi:hypothetical protein